MSIDLLSIVIKYLVEIIIIISYMSQAKIQKLKCYFSALVRGRVLKNKNNMKISSTWIRKINENN